MSFPKQQPDWCNLDIIHRNALPPAGSLLLEDLDPVTWANIEVPGMWQLQGYGRPICTNVNYPFPVDPPNIPILNETGSYWRQFTTPRDWKGQQIRLRFEGVDNAFHVWANDKEVGYSQGSRNASEFDISQFLAEAGATNTLAVRVYEFCDGSCLERQDHWLLSGIFRDVYLVAFPTVSIVDFTIRPQVDESLAKVSIHVNVSLQGGQGEDVVVELHSPRLQEMRMKPSEDGTMVVEGPTLNTVIMTVQGSSIAQRVGFRRIERKSANFLVNRKPLILYRINHHEHHHLYGCALPFDNIRADLILIKQHNINALRCSHQPNNPRLYGVCGEVGIYVMAEADIETHGFNTVERTAIKDADIMDGRELQKLSFSQAKRWTSDNPEWRAAYMDRAVQLVKRFQNYTSVIFWSLGNEAFYGANHAAMYQWIKQKGPSRLVHYEGDAKFVAHHTGRPLIQCEYGHAMGNGPGGQANYIELYRSEPLLQGGYIWEWCSHGLLKREGKLTYFAYVANFEDSPNDRDFVMDGLVFSDSHTRFETGIRAVPAP
ncbi:unnamed protein product [Clonostachys rosea f. rosea IK726]|uniref:Uncharacterized protein n=1 Tax=Clonostachys rosea f. rosea IK726 TaxID=1349383 RepID=A0ACA9TLN1_BIOOC|nr:unnamed protein product [Clonostachys rosea f. rosea IK726]